jgi:Family of unknown function (DUF5999)
MCTHEPRCPDAAARDRLAAHNVAAHPEQGWTLLCNGVIVFDDLGFLLPDGRRETGTETNTIVLRTRQVLPAAAAPILAVAA